MNLSLVCVIYSIDIHAPVSNKSMKYKVYFMYVKWYIEYTDFKVFT